MGLVSAPRHLLGLSLPARVSVLVAVFLIICAVVAFVRVLRAEWHADPWWWLRRWETVIVIALVAVIPVVVYSALKLWLEGSPSRFPDLDSAWREGLRVLEEHGLDLSNIPLFLVLGMAEHRKVEALFRAAALDWVVQDVPQGRAPLRWYANERGVFLVCLDASRLSQVSKLAATTPGTRAPVASDIRGTLETPAALRGTMEVTSTGVQDSWASSRLRDTADPDGESGFGAAGAIRGTLVPSAGGSTATASRPAAPLLSSPQARREAEEQTERLRYLCEQLFRARQPLCPLNGILTLLPWEILEDVVSAHHMPEAVRTDLETIQQTAKLRCPVTALVVGMEKESGFTELVRRVGAKRAKEHRFGKGFDVWNPPTDERIDALSAHACGAFEDWVYSLFREKDGLNKPGNAKCYALLCKIRSQMRARLRNVLLHGYSFDPKDRQAESRAILFSGCYFAATGETEDRQAFVKNVFEKLLELEEELQWTDQALSEDDRYQSWARVATTTSGLLALALAAMLVYKYMFQ